MSLPHLLTAPHLLTPPHLFTALAPVGAYDLTSGRLWSLAAALLGLAGAAVGGFALARPASGRRAFFAMGAGLAGAVGGALVVAAAEGGPGTGYGIVGGYVALVVGLAALALCALALTRSRRT